MDPLTEGGLIAWRNAMELLVENMQKMEVFTFRDMAALGCFMAGEATAAIREEGWAAGCSDEGMDAAAKEAYRMADALLKARGEQDD